MATAAVPMSASQSKHPLRNRNFRLLWAGSAVSVLGDQFYLVALPWVVLQLTGSGVAMGTVLMAAALPRGILMLLGGAFSDRFSARKIMMATASTRTVFVVAIGVLLYLHVLLLWEIYLLSVAFGIADAFAAPAAQTYLPFLVDSDQLAPANSAMQSTRLLAGIVGPAPAGIIMKTMGAAWAFLLDGISFLFIIGALWRLPDSPKRPAGAARRNIWREIGEGLNYVRADTALFSLMLLAAVMNFCTTGPTSVGLAYMAHQRFASPAAYGIWISSFAGGALAGILLAGFLKVKRRGVLFLITASIMGLGVLFIGVLPGLWPLAALLAAMGCFNGFLGVQLQTWFQQRVERPMLGRVMSVLMLSAFGLMPISMAIAGFAVEWSVAWMFAAAGIGMILVSAFGALQKPVREIA